MASGKAPYITGSVDGTGSALEVSHEKVGFRPKVVKLYNVEDSHGGTEMVWIDSMADASAYKSVNSNTGVFDTSFVTSDGVTPLATGFTIGADAQMNVAGELIRFEAWG